MNRSIRSLVALAALLSCASPAPPPVADAEARRALAQGEVVGRLADHDTHAWQGLPYAAPPVGALRWRAPRPPAPWEGVREALAPGSICPQLANELDAPDAETGTVVGDEDCLVLNVFAPRFAADRVPRGADRLPVMVWIHGGGNSIGSGGFYDGSRLAGEQRVVVVTINYRLGGLGWFRHAALRAEAADAAERSGNFGTLDTIRALEWVRENIAAFGGDPRNVTVFGESAGGRNTVSLLVSPMAKGLFHRAIAESAGTRSVTPAEAENRVDDPVAPGLPSSANEILLRLLQADGTAADRDAAKRHAAGLGDAGVAAYLRSKTPAEFIGAYLDDGEEPGLGMVRMPGIVRDGHVLPLESAHERFASGRTNRVPTILGTNRDEPKLFMAGDPKHVQRFLGVFARLRDAERYDLVAGHKSRAWKANAVDEIATRIARWPGAPVFAYRFDWDEEPTILFADYARIVGAAHLFEVPFVFGVFDLGPRSNLLFDGSNEAGREALSAQMRSYWAQFARSGDPGRGGRGELPAWTAFDPAPGASKMLILDTPEGGGARMSSESVMAADVMDGLVADARLPDPVRCGVVEDIARSYPLVLAAKPEARCDGAAVAAAGD